MSLSGPILPGPTIPMDGKGQGSAGCSVGAGRHPQEGMVKTVCIRSPLQVRGKQGQFGSLDKGLGDTGTLSAKMQG